MTLKNYITTKGPTIATIVIYTLLNIGFFAWNFVSKYSWTILFSKNSSLHLAPPSLYLHDNIVFALDDTKINVIGWGLPFSRGFAQMLKFNTALILLTVSRNLLTTIRGTWNLYKVNHRCMFLFLSFFLCLVSFWFSSVYWFILTVFPARQQYYLS